MGKTEKKNCPFNYSGSKCLYTELSQINEPVIDLFSGGGGFYSNAKSTKIIVNDICEPLVGFQKMIYCTTEEEFNNIIKVIYGKTEGINSREEYESLRARFNESKDPLDFYSVLACCTNNLIRFNSKGGFNQTWGKRKFNPSMEEKLRSFRERIKSKEIEFRTGSFENITENEGWLYFVDPPYLASAGNSGGAGYNTMWNEAMEHKLYSFLADKKFILTNFIRKADNYNHILQEAIEKNDWKRQILRIGSMKAQRKTEQTFEELVVADSQETLDKVKLPTAF